MDLVEKIYNARRIGAPLIAISTVEPASLVEAIQAKFEAGKTPIPIVQWDPHQGLTGLNEAGLAVLASKDVMGEDQDSWPGLSANPVSALDLMRKLPGEIKVGDELKQRATLVFAHNLGRFIEDKPSGGERGVAIQGVWNLRDLYKRNRRTLIMVGPMFKLPTELSQDVLVFDDPLPTEDQLRAIVEERSAAALERVKNAKPLDISTIDESVDALRSLSAFAAEQVVALSMSERGMDVDALWERKIAALEQIDGIKVDRYKISFDDAGGLDQFKKFAMRLAKGKNAPLVIVRVDEFEKQMAGIGAGASAANGGVQNQDKLGVVLRTMEDMDWPGILIAGPPGTGKSLATKALANAASKITGRRVLALELDLGATEASLVGESEKKIRAVMKALASLAGKGRLIFVATCNRLTILPPELKRRFRLGTWMFDLPTREEKDAVWTIQLKAYFGDKGLKMKRPDDTDWTQADIRNVCDISDRLSCTLEEAVQFIVPVSKSDPAAINNLRQLAHDSFLSGAYAGPYLSPGPLGTERRPIAAPAAKGRVSRGGEEV